MLAGVKRTKGHYNRLCFIIGRNVYSLYWSRSHLKFVSQGAQNIWCFFCTRQKTSLLFCPKLNFLNITSHTYVFLWCKVVHNMKKYFWLFFLHVANDWKMRLEEKLDLHFLKVKYHFEDFKRRSWGFRLHENHFTIRKVEEPEPEVRLPFLFSWIEFKLVKFSNVITERRQIMPFLMDLETFLFSQNQFKNTRVEIKTKTSGNK